MRLSIFVSSIFFYLALSSSHDVEYIRKLINEEALFVDAKLFSQFDIFYLPNATYRTIVPALVISPLFVGLTQIETTLADTVKNYTIFTSVSTESTRLLPPFDEQGSAFAARVVSYQSTTSFGDPNNPKNSSSVGYSIIAGKAVDDLVKTGDRNRFDGWRINKRTFTQIVSANCEIVQRGLYQLAYKTLLCRGSLLEIQTGPV